MQLRGEWQLALMHGVCALLAAGRLSRFGRRNCNGSTMLRDHRRELEMEYVTD